MKYRKKPVEVEAFWFGIDPMPDWFMDKAAAGDVIVQPGNSFEVKSMTANINTLEGVMHAKYGDVIIKGVAGELCPCQPDIFLATYEAVEE